MKLDESQPIINQDFLIGTNQGYSSLGNKTSVYMSFFVESTEHVVWTVDLIFFLNP